MDRERHQRAKEVFHHAEKLDGGEREAYLVEACSGDADLVEEVRRLLRLAEEMPESYLEPPRVEDRGRSHGPPLETGQTVSHYEILEKLGEGGMGEVYRAVDTTLKRQVALKVLSADLAASRERMERLQREAEALAALDHPNIVTVYSLEEVGGIRFLTMQLVEGKPLDQLIPRGGMSLSRILEMAIPLADALAAAHERGVVHRDLKPSNIMVTEDRGVKVLDFGLAKRLAASATTRDRTQTQEAALTKAGAVMGTVAYMGPEQLRGEPTHQPADIWALGIVLCEMATGTRPFKGQTGFQLGAAVLSEDPTPIPSDIPSGLRRVIERCLQKAPGQRYPSAKELRVELELLRRDTTSTQASAPVVAARSAGEKPPPPQRRLISGVLGGTAMVLLVATALWLVPQIGERVALKDQASDPAGPATASIAVLPFADMSPEKDQEYLADGLAEELLNLLAQIEDLNVAARTSSFSFKDKGVDIATIAERLGVSTVLEGSVRKSGNQIRISAQLVNAADGFDLWSETYNRQLDDIFAVQDDIARSVAEALRVTLLGASSDVPAARSASSEAYNFYLRGKHLAERRRDAEEIEKAIGYFERALALDPDYASAWVGLAYALTNQMSHGYLPYDGEIKEEAVAAVEKALELDENLPEAWAVLAEIRMELEWAWKEAERALRRGRELAPENPDVIRKQAELAIVLGRLEEAMELAHRATALDPLNPSAHSVLVWACLFAGRLDEANAALERYSELDPDAYTSRVLYELMRLRPEAALVLCDRVEVWHCRALAFHALGRKQEADAAVEEYIEKHQDRRAYAIAEIWAFRGETDHAFEWLDRAYIHRDPWLLDVKTNPLFANLHDDLRWLPFLEKMDLAD